MESSGLIKVPAYAQIQYMDGVYPMTEKTIVLGRQSEYDWCQNRKTNQGSVSFNSEEKVSYFQVTNSKKVSKEAIKIYEE